MAIDIEFSHHESPFLLATYLKLPENLAPSLTPSPFSLDPNFECWMTPGGWPSKHIPVLIDRKHNKAFIRTTNIRQQIVSSSHSILSILSLFTCRSKHIFSSSVDENTNFIYTNFIYTNYYAGQKNKSILPAPFI